MEYDMTDDPMEFDPEVEKAFESAIGRLVRALRHRSAFIENALRIGIREGSSWVPLARVLARREWRTSLLTGLTANDQPVPDMDELVGEGRRRLYEARERAQGEERPDDPINRWVCRNLLAYLVKDRRGIESPSFAEWLQWLEREVLICYDAATLEALANRDLVGKIAVDAFKRSHSAAAKFSEDQAAGAEEAATPDVGPYDPTRYGRDLFVEEFLVSAQQGDQPSRLERREGAPADSAVQSEGGVATSVLVENRLDVWAFVGRCDDVVDTVAALLQHGRPLRDWIDRLLKEASKRGVLRLLERTLEASGMPEPDWFLEPDRIVEVVTAATRIYETAKVRLYLDQVFKLARISERYLTAAEEWTVEERAIELARMAELAPLDVLVAMAARYRSDPEKLTNKMQRIGERDRTAELETLEDARTEFVSNALFRNSDKEDTESWTFSRIKKEVDLTWVWWKAFDGLWPDAADVVRAFVEGFPPTNVDRSAFPETEVWDSRPPLPDQGRTAVSSTGNRSKVKVTVFGAGIAGLTAAHELAERNFDVTVVEVAPRVSRGLSGTDKESDVQVGGLARTQWSIPDLRSPDPKEGRAAGAYGYGYFDAKRIRTPAVMPSAPRPGARLDPNDGVYPAEHGYRFFPSFYRHVFDTMKRTPLRKRAPGTFTTAFNQLEPTYKQAFARRQQYVPLSRPRARSLESFRHEYMQLVEGLGFERRDIARFFFKLVRYLMTCSARREAQYEPMNFMEFLGGESFYSPPFVANIKAAPQALVAMNAKHCDARTQLNVYLQLLMDQVLGGEYTDGTLRGPTSSAWLIPWKQYLRKLKVHFVHANLRAIESADDAYPGGDIRVKLKERLVHANLRAIESVDDAYPGGDIRVILEYVKGSLTEDTLDKSVGAAQYYVVAVDAVSAEQVTATWRSAGVPHDLRHFASYVSKRLTGRLYQYQMVGTFRSPRGGAPADRIRREQAEVLLKRVLTLLAPKKKGRRGRAIRSVRRAVSDVTGSLQMDGKHAAEIRVSLWSKTKLDRAELYPIVRAINQELGSELHARFLSDQGNWNEDPPEPVRTPRLPERCYGDCPEDRFQTFSGVQFYFTQDFKLMRGHVYYPDTDWGLSSVSQAQFWDNPALRRLGILGILSVDIGDCQKKSSYSHRSVMESSPLEIATEVWRQVEDSLRTTRGEGSLISSLPLPKPEYYHVDENLRFAGKGVRQNRTPFLINNAGDWQYRPRCTPWVPGTSRFVNVPRTDAPDVWQAAHGGYRVHNNKVVFCGHYMRTFTRMTTMEAANESARHAVNAILDHMAYGPKPAGYTEHERISGDYCDIWDMEDYELDDLKFFKRVDEMLFAAGKPHIADILQFDKIADLQNPELGSGQALATALGVTVGKDWGIEPQEIAAAMNGLVQVARAVGGELRAAYGLPDVSIPNILSMLRGDKN
jgi:uncharacterized protein with NAD-binding domain and iron-sulfur cluster